MQKVTAIVISFLRPGWTKACVLTLRKQYPGIKIIVGENGDRNESLAKVCEENDAQYVELEFDSGVCGARNALMKLVDTPYVLVGDDDFYYDDDAKVDSMLGFLENNDQFDLIGGRVRVNGEVKNYQGYITKFDDHFESTPILPEGRTFKRDPVSDLQYIPADLTFNYFVARTDKVIGVPWDEEIKVAYEHFSWFYDFKCAGGRVVFSPDPIVIHKPSHIDPEQDVRYGSFRNRKEDKMRFFSKYKLKYTIGMNGVKTMAPDPIASKRKFATKYVDFCITTFMRPKALEKLLFSIARYYPTANVYVADQNEVFDRAFYKDLRDRLFEAGLMKRPSIENLPYDCGLSYARNHLVVTTPNKYKLILDDDFEFMEETDIGKFVDLLEGHPYVGIVGGRVQQKGVDIHFEFTFEKHGTTIFQVPDKTSMRTYNGISYRRTGCVLNFAMMRKDLFNSIRWDNDLKVTEHMDFYLRMQKIPYQIFYTPDVVIDHPPAERDPGYKELRQRTEFIVKMLRKHGATRVKYLNGQITEILPDGSIKRFKENPS